MYIRLDYLIYIDQDFYHLASTLANTNNLLALELYYLANTPTNINDILKVNLYYLANTPTNTNDEVDHFIKERLVAFK